MVVYDDIDVKKFVFGMLHLFKMQGLLGKKDGYMSKRGFVLMLLSWL